MVFIPTNPPETTKSSVPPSVLLYIFISFWSDAKNKVYANLIVHDGGSKPTEQECIDGLATLQSDFDDKQTKNTNDKASGKTKLKNLGLTDDEIKALTGA